MSVIGTTYKQPRVFAPEATALEDLCGATGVITVLVAAPPAEGGSGYTAPGVYTTNSPNGGIGATVEVLTVDGSGGVLTFALAEGGEHYNGGDILTLVGGDNNCRIEVQTVSRCTAWSMGDPVAPTSPTFNSVNYTFEKSNYYWSSGGVGGVRSGRACSALYIGADMATLEVIQEGKALRGAPTNPAAAQTPTTTYHNVPAGSFLPISVVTVVSATATTPGDLPAGGVEEVILALF